MVISWKFNTFKEDFRFVSGRLVMISRRRHILLFEMYYDWMYSIMSRYGRYFPGCHSRGTRNFKLNFNCCFFKLWLHWSNHKWVTKNTSKTLICLWLFVSFDQSKTLTAQSTKSVNTTAKMVVDGHNFWVIKWGKTEI